AAHEVALLPIYAASEAPINGITSDRMAEGMRQRGHKDVSLCADLEEARAHALRNMRAGKVVVLMGAGSIGGLAQQLRDEIAEASE
ncbi:MAG TPA: UDP-N-acetylmuramate--L-alanine ligase, partial [Mariprofundaceae bacterium]|nr:UDP-N-acetylmuramate--L-alanine ligase [Mariprofundaceae bacterium]